jgi:protein TonB
MDDAGFMTARTQAASRPLPTPAAPAFPAPRPKGRRRGALGPGVAVAALLHVAILAPLALARPEIRDRLIRPEPMTIYIEMVRPPAPKRTAQPDRPKAETPPPPTRVQPLPFTPRESAQPTTPPPVVSPFVPPRAEPAPVRTPEPRADAPATEPAPPAPAAADTGATASAFNNKVIAALARAKRYPPDARARREEGTATLAITLNRSGRVLNAEVTRSSGSKSLDRAALETARRAAMPGVPAELSDPLRVVVALEFALK